MGKAIFWVVVILGVLMLARVLARSKAASAAKSKARQAAPTPVQPAAQGDPEARCAARIVAYICHGRKPECSAATPGAATSTPSLVHASKAKATAMKLDAQGWLRSRQRNLANTIAQFRPAPPRRSDLPASLAQHQSATGSFLNGFVSDLFLKPARHHRRSLVFQRRGAARLGTFPDRPEREYSRSSSAANNVPGMPGFQFLQGANAAMIFRSASNLKARMTCPSLRPSSTISWPN